jgi:SagB-type dehydrogenase family enzyme
MIPTTGQPHYLRSAPSAGGLYPAEIYVVSHGTSLLPLGLYNYQAKDHSLVRFWDSDVWQKLQNATFEHPACNQTDLILVITAVLYRSAWRYQDRAYRRIFLDTGHLLGNIELACAISGFRPYLIGSFADSAINNLLYLTEAEEGTIALVPLLDWLKQPELPTLGNLLPMPVQSMTTEVPDGELLAYFHQATQMSSGSAWQAIAKPNSHGDKYNFPFCLRVATTTQPIDWGKSLSNLPETMLKRRSTREYSGAALTLAQLKALLDFTYQPQNYVEQGLDGEPDYFDLSLIETFITVSNVTGLDDGCYYYAPACQELRQIRFKNFRSELHFLCLGQNLGRDAAAVLFHTADLRAAVSKWGDRVYRYLHMDAGHLGQRLNLAAIRLGLGVSGIAGFFDDQVNEVLGIPADEAVLYITTLGRA